MDPNLIVGLVVVAVLALAYYVYKYGLKIPGVGQVGGRGAAPAHALTPAEQKALEEKLKARIMALDLAKVSDDTAPERIPPALNQAAQAVAKDRAGKTGEAEAQAYAAAVAKAAATFAQAIPLIQKAQDAVATALGAQGAKAEATPAEVEQMKALMQGWPAQLAAARAASDRLLVVLVGTADVKKMDAALDQNPDAAFAAGVAAMMGMILSGVAAGLDDSGKSSGGKEAMCIGRAGDAYCCA